MPLLARFDTPAFLTDAPAGSAFYDQWSSFLSTLIGGTAVGTNGGAFYDPTVTDVAIAGEKQLVWMGFPRDQVLPFNRDNITAAYISADSNLDTRQFQNEYFEWFAEKDKRGKIRKLTFVTETPEYYQQLWNFDRNIVVNLYRTLVNPAVTEASLRIDIRTSLDTGNYTKFNRWNTRDGIVHYIQNINTMRAAVGLARDSVIVAPPYRDNYEAEPGLSSAFTSVDPRVSFDVNMLSRKGLYVSFKNPPGLYIAGWNDSGFSKPDGSAAGNYWRMVRGIPGRVLRLEYEVPAAEGFVVGDMKIGGRPIEYGGQVAEQITVTLGGIAGTTARR
jgi:hypothetical protein